MINDASVNPEENVEIIRRRLRSAVRRYRLNAELTQKEAAKKLGFSESKLLRLEQGTQAIQPSDMRAMMQLYRETDLARVESFVSQAIHAQRQKGYDAYSDIASREYQELMGLEAGAEAIYKFESSVVPGLLQTEEYARNLSRGLGHNPEKVERQVELRMLRQRKLGLEGPEHPELDFILGEAALARKVGSAEIMNEQINHLLKLAKDSAINLAFLPFEAGPHRSMGGAFTVIQFGDPELTDLLYLEGPTGESISRDEEEHIKLYKDIFVELLERASQYGSFEDQVEDIRRSRYADLTNVND